MSPLECKCLLCYLIHFHWVHSFSGNRFQGLFFFFLTSQHMHNGLSYIGGVEWVGTGWDRMGWGGV